MTPDEFEDVSFRRRRRAVPARSALQWGWISMAVVGLVITALLMRALIHRTSGTAGASSETLAPAAEPAREVTYASASAANGYQERAVPIQRPSRSLYRCRDRSGVVTLRSEGCLPEERFVGAMPILIDEADSQPMTVLPQREARTANAPQAMVITTSRQRPSACEFAKQERKAVRDRLGLSATYDTITSLDEMVRQACR